MWSSLIFFSLDDLRSVFQRKVNKLNSVTGLFCHSYQRKSGIGGITISIEWKDQNQQFVWDFFFFLQQFLNILLMQKLTPDSFVSGVIRGWTPEVFCYSCGFDQNITCMCARVFLSFMLTYLHPHTPTNPQNHAKAT